MIADVDRIDLTSKGTHALSTNNDSDQDNIELNAERKPYSVMGYHIYISRISFDKKTIIFS